MMIVISMVIGSFVETSQQQANYLVNIAQTNFSLVCPKIVPQLSCFKFNCALA